MGSSRQLINIDDASRKPRLTTRSEIWQQQQQQPLLQSRVPGIARLVRPLPPRWLSRRRGTFGLSSTPRAASDSRSLTSRGCAQSTCRTELSLRLARCWPKHATKTAGGINGLAGSCLLFAGYLGNLGPPRWVCGWPGGVGRVCMGVCARRVCVCVRVCVSAPRALPERRVQTNVFSCPCAH
jgi:hypothetical protein